MAQKTMRCRKMDCTFHCNYTEPEEWRAHLATCSVAGSRFYCPFTECKDAGKTIFNVLDEVYKHENKNHAVWICVVCQIGFLTLRKALGHVFMEHDNSADHEVANTSLDREWVSDYSKFQNGTKRSIRKEDRFDLAREDDDSSSHCIQEEIQRFMRSCGFINADTCADQCPDPSTGDWIAGFVEGQLDSTARFLAAVPARSARVTAGAVPAPALLTPAHLHQLANKAKELGGVLERCEHEHEHQGHELRQREMPSTPSAQRRSVHWENDSTEPERPFDVEKETVSANNNRYGISHRHHHDRLPSSPTATILRSATTDITGGGLPEIMARTVRAQSSPQMPPQSQRTWPLRALEPADTADTTTTTSYETDTSDIDGDPYVVNPITGEPLQAIHLSPEDQKRYFAELEVCCVGAAFDFYERHQSRLSAICDRRGQPLCKSPIEKANDLTLPQWTHLLRRLADAKGLKHDMVSRLVSFNGEIQPVDEVRHAVAKEKIKSDREILALVQTARTFCRQLKDWEKCKLLDDLYGVVEVRVRDAKKLKREKEKRVRMEEEARVLRTRRTWSHDEKKKRRQGSVNGAEA